MMLSFVGQGVGGDANQCDWSIPGFCTFPDFQFDDCDVRLILYRENTCFARISSRVLRSHKSDLFIHVGQHL